jgi:enoyl-CoA hydratase
MIDAEEALRVGLIDRIVDPAEDLMKEANVLAAEICKNGITAIKAAKKAISEGLDVPLDTGLAMEKTAFSGLFGNEDQIEGMSAFLEKRPPKFKNK